MTRATTKPDIPPRTVLLWAGELELLVRKLKDRETITHRVRVGAERYKMLQTSTDFLTSNIN